MDAWFAKVDYSQARQEFSDGWKQTLKALPGLDRSDAQKPDAAECLAEDVEKTSKAAGALEPLTADDGKRSAIAPVDLGSIHVQTPVVLSPMAGVTNWPFRTICEAYGAEGLYVAEMVTSRALVARNPKAFRLCRFAPSERPRSLQLYGVNPEITAQAARMVVEGDLADHVDLNFGCPVPKVTRRGGGSALPWKSDLFRELIHRVVEVCQPAGIPVTAKIRVGIDHEHETFLEAGRIAEDEGCAAVTLHARTTAEYYGGHSDWSKIRQLVEALDIPVFGNGDIWGADDALEMVRQTGCAGVAVGRGCQGRPWIFSDIKHAFAGDSCRFDPTLGQVGHIILAHGRLLTDFYDGDERMAVHDLRKHIAWYLKGFPVGGSTRKAFMESESLSDVESVLSRLDPSVTYPARVENKPRGRVRYAKKVHLPYGWLDSRTTTHSEREQLFGDDPMDASY
ncbi:putative TIM-barrel protein, nifR3 family [Bifidobacterium bohemicum]|uniref:tRNA-dihydrouridine synthase n=2 Tax=Bifidobacterium bohemicum TaxID=638617 RepID=A0A086ZGI8_9BIFI|nr:tRNA-dihydrouridine synthase [Bifidobacterium bohemicum DSM 22767]SCB99886.1 putative TIM-barrel protein, nifR3 family [Bifidobacterium bohemicum]